MLSLYLSLHEFPPGASVSPQYSKNMHVGLIQDFKLSADVTGWLSIYFLIQAHPVLKW